MTTALEPPRLRHRVSTLTASTLSFALSAGAVVSPDSLVVLTSACANHERVRFQYRGHDSVDSARHVEPIRLVASGRRWYLVAFDLDRDDWRTFRVDRMTDPRATGARAQHRSPPAAAVEDFLRARIMGMAPTFRADVTLHAPRQLIAARLGDNLGDGTLTGNNSSCRWHSHADTVEWLAMRLLSLDTRFQVHGPPQLQATSTSWPLGSDLRVRTGALPEARDRWWASVAFMKWG